VIDDAKSNYNISSLIVTHGKLNILQNWYNKIQLVLGP